LRMITVYAELLAQRCAGEIESGRDTGIFLSYIVQGATRMRELLADLLTYAEVGTPGEESIDQIDLNLVVQKVLGNLSVSIDESGAVIAIPTLPMLSGHEVDFIQLFQNLLANAIKYRGERPPTIYISTEARDGWIEFAVSDDGIGIAHEHHEAIFQPFKRLRDRSGSGTGMGLAICQRIVERYGGRIWVDSHRDQGATFHFMLPESVVGTQAGREWRSTIDPRVPVR
jgi:chemotaxis family two-component system sensor kinase Cph1